MSFAERCRYLGNPDQLCSVRRLRVEDGRAKGTEEYQVKTGGGLSFSVLPDNGMDLGELTYRGVNVSFLTKNGCTAPALAETYENGFVRYFPAGMMYTCGLMSTGGGTRDGEVWHPSHGRYHNQPAKEVGGWVSNDRLTVRGKVRETEFFGYALEVDRTVEAEVGGSSLTLTDRLTNLTPNPTEFTVLYHWNFGYPFLCPNTRLILPDGTQTRGRTPWAQEHLAEHREFCAPKDNEEEQVFFHDVPSENGVTSVRVENPDLGMGAELSFSSANLPVLAEWKCMNSGEYVLGLEPANNYILGRAEERWNGTLKTLAPFETLEYRLQLRFYDL